MDIDDQSMSDTIESLTVRFSTNTESPSVVLLNGNPTPDIGYQDHCNILNNGSDYGFPVYRNTAFVVFKRQIRSSVNLYTHTIYLVTTDETQYLESFQSFYNDAEVYGVEAEIDWTPI